MIVELVERVTASNSDNVKSGFFGSKLGGNGNNGGNSRENTTFRVTLSSAAAQPVARREKQPKVLARKEKREKPAPKEPVTSTSLDDDLDSYMASK